MSLATEWVARIFAVSLLMILPGVAGQWLDARFGTRFLALVGFGFGFCAGFVALLAMVKTKQSDPAPSDSESPPQASSQDSRSSDHGHRSE